MNSLRDFQNFLARELYGQTKEEALVAGTCIACKKNALARCKTELGLKEYRISGLCEICWEAATKDPADDRRRKEPS